MTRRDVLRLGAVGTGIFATGGLTRVAARATAQSRAVPTVDRLVMTNVVDNIYDVFAKGGTLDSITVERAGLRFGADTLLAEHGLAYHLESVRGSERRQILLDFSLTERNLFNNYKVLKVDPAAADGLIISHGHADHYGALADYARFVQGRTKPGLTLYAGGEDTFCHRVVVTRDEPEHRLAVDTNLTEDGIFLAHPRKGRVGLCAEAVAVEVVFPGGGHRVNPDGHRGSTSFRPTRS